MSWEPRIPGQQCNWKEFAEIQKSSPGKCTHHAQLRIKVKTPQSTTQSNRVTLDSTMYFQDDPKSLGLICKTIKGVSIYYKNGQLLPSYDPKNPRFGGRILSISPLGSLRQYIQLMTMLQSVLPTTFFNAAKIIADYYGGFHLGDGTFFRTAHPESAIASTVPKTPVLLEPPTESPLSPKKITDSSPKTEKESLSSFEDEEPSSPWVLVNQGAETQEVALDSNTSKSGEELDSWDTI